MANGNIYPAVIVDANGNEKAGEFIQYTDSSNQPEPGTIFKGWTSDAADPANVATNGGVLIAGTDGANGVAVIAPFGLNVQRPSDGNTVFGIDTGTNDRLNASGLTSQPSTGDAVAAFVASGGAGATIALDAGGLLLTNAGAAAAATSVPRLSQLTSALTITSGTLPNTGAWVSGTAKVNPVARQITVCVEVVCDGTANAATCVIAISPDNSTHTTIATPGVSAAVNTVGGSTSLASVTVPAGWYIKLTLSHTTVAASIYY